METDALNRMYFDYNINGTPHVMFDGGYESYRGAPYGSAAYAADIATCGARPVDDLSLSVSVSWLGDAELEATVIIQADGSPGNNPPVLASIGSKQVIEESLLSFSVSASDVDSPSPDLTIEDEPSGASLTDNGDGTGQFNWTPSDNQAGQYTVTFKATDNMGAVDSELVVITVQDNCLDVDGDGVCYDDDNCPETYNANQADDDGDGYGNVCDNCPSYYNPAQIDSDSDGYGDGCDNCPVQYNADQGDSDGDGIGNICDNCSSVSNPSQSDSDGDGAGNECDVCPSTFDPMQYDSDGDGLGNECDNCAYASNAGQEDSDGDGAGDACDVCPDDYDPAQTDSDSDGLGNECDNCPTESNVSQTDSDGDGAGDACDVCPDLYDPAQADQDNDGHGDLCDNCVGTYNPSQTDTDGDGIGDLCDNCVVASNADQADDDSDDVGDICDNCDTTYNPTQADQDSDGIGNACDNCPSEYNPTQTDSDGDGTGDACQLALDVDDGDIDGLPGEYRLWQNYPNPFNPSTDIRFDLPRAASVTLDVYNISGQLVARLADETLSAGTHTFVWDGFDQSGQPVTSGVYFYRLDTGVYTATRKMVLIR